MTDNGKRTIDKRTVIIEERHNAILEPCDVCGDRRATLELHGPKERLFVAVCEKPECREAVADYFRFYAEHVTTLVDSARELLDAASA